ncbi:hypothetical protein DFH11DRAFT_869507 [Phellopilus nigrolimitatus]|nr:hypothetical protein DFH11DRAFT_869507 [Phellopilus nigrolimitatus]
MTVLSKSIDSLYFSSQSLTRTEKTLSILERSFALFSKVLTTGAFRVVQAIESGILRSIIACHAILDRHVGFFTQLLVTFSNCLVSYPPTLSAVGAAIINMPRDIHDQLLKSVMGDRWKRFFGLFLEHFLLMCYYRCIRDSGRTCEPCGLIEKGKEYALKQCGYCKQALYCSAKCQIAAWKKHKKNCKVLKLQYRDVSTKNIAFIRFLAEHDVRRHLPGLRILASRKYPSVNFQDLAVSIDYSSSPPTLDVSPAVQLELLSKEMPVVAPCGQLLHNPNFAEVRGSKGKLGIMKLRFSSTTAEPLVSYHNFPVSVPFFCSITGSSRRRKDAEHQNVHATEFLDLEGHSVQAAWDIANELMLRCGVTPDTYFGGEKIDELLTKAFEEIRIVCMENTYGDMKEMSDEELHQQLVLRLSAFMAGERDLRDYLWKASRS